MQLTVEIDSDKLEAFKALGLKVIEPIPTNPQLTPWEPKGGEWTIDMQGHTVFESNSNTPYRLAGLEYPSKAAAQLVVTRLSSYTRQLAWLAENDDDWVTHWDNPNQPKWFILYDNKLKRYTYDSDLDIQTPTTIYMSESNAEKLTELLNQQVVVF